MVINVESIIDKAIRNRGSLSNLKTTRGRRRHEIDEDDPLPIDVFKSDKAKLMMSKTVRVMGGKTQVFSFPESLLVRNRLSHVMEVVGNSLVAADMLGLNTDLVEAAAYGHDIGHMPFGHQGEAWMAKMLGRPYCHEKMAPIIAQHIERKGKGLNLCHQTLVAMMRHSGNMATHDMTAEAWVLRYADKIAYIFADANDIFLRTKYPMPTEIRDLLEVFGKDQRRRGTVAICGLVLESIECGRISFEESELGIAFKRLQNLMYQIYPRVTRQDVDRPLEKIFRFLEMIGIGDPALLLALMTDRDAKLVLDSPMPDMQVFNRTTVSEIVPYLGAIGRIDMCNPDLDW